MRIVATLQRIYWIVTAVFVLCACGDYPLRESAAPQNLATKVMPVTAGVSDRARVHDLLGEPWLSSQYWRIDVFRTSDRNSWLHWYLFPMGISSEAVFGYVLVSYEPSGIVAAIDQGVASEGDSFTSKAPEVLFLQAGDFRLASADKAKSVILLVEGDRRDDFLRSRVPPGRCRAIVGCSSYNRGKHYCPLLVSFDGEAWLDLDMPASSARIPSNVYSPVMLTSLQPGTHLIKARKSTRIRSADVGQSSLTCTEDETVYASVALETIASGRRLFGPWTTTASIDVSQEPPVLFGEKPLMIYRDQYRVEHFEIRPED